MVFSFCILHTGVSEVMVKTLRMKTAHYSPYGIRRHLRRGAQAVHIAQCAKMCAAQPARVQMMQRHGPACERDR
jgi:hypothetical protein